MSYFNLFFPLKQRFLNLFEGHELLKDLIKAMNLCTGKIYTLEDGPNPQTNNS